MWPTLFIIYCVVALVLTSTVNALVDFLGKTGRRDLMPTPGTMTVMIVLWPVTVPLAFLVKRYVK